jgi:hypothetical protein
MITAFTTGFYSKLKLWPTTWTAGTAYAKGAIMKPTAYASHAYICSTAGTSAAVTEPTWGTTNGGTTADGAGTLVWTCFDTLTYNTVAPQTAVVPYVTFGLLTDMPIGTFEHIAAIEDMTFYVNCFTSTSVAHAMILAGLVNTALSNVTLTITGYTSMVCKREYVGSVIYDADSKIYQIPLRYRVQGSL